MATSPPSDMTGQSCGPTFDIIFDIVNNWAHDNNLDVMGPPPPFGPFFVGFPVNGHLTGRCAKHAHTHTHTRTQQPNTAQPLPPPQTNTHPALGRVRRQQPHKDSAGIDFDYRLCISCAMQNQDVTRAIRFGYGRPLLSDVVVHVPPNCAGYLLSSDLGHGSGLF
jgi:hypothetical protein